jgi:hypothetical protein
VIEHRQPRRCHTILNCTGLVQKPHPAEAIAVTMNLIVLRR